MNEQDIVMNYFMQKKDKVCATMLLRKERRQEKQNGTEESSDS